jgi:chromosome segregation ATPase
MTGVSQQVEQTRRNDLAMFENMQAESSKALFEAQQAAEEAYLARSALSTQLSEKEADLDAARQQMQQLSAQSADYQSSQEQQTEQIAAMFQELQDSKTTLTQMQQELEDTRKSSQAALFEANAALDKAVSDAREAAFAEGHEQATTATKSWFHGSASALNPIETDKGRFYPLDYLEKNPHMRSQLASERGVPGMLNMQDATSSPSTDDSSEEQVSTT